MSQPITNLTKDDHICMTETVDGVSENVLFRIICTPESNPYGGCYFVVREYATGKGSGESNFQYNNTSTEVNYEDSLLDRFMTGEYAERFDEATLACIEATTITCFNFAESASYTLARKFFAMSNKELGGSYSNDESLSLGYFTSNTLRITKNKAGNAASVWSRSPGSASTVCFVYTSGNFNTYSPTNYIAARPAFNLSASCLVASEPNEDGSYNLIPDESVPNKRAGLTALLGETETMPAQIRAECEAVFDGSVTVFVCNNYNDTEPAWEETALGVSHTFANRTKTAEKWAVGIRIEAESESSIAIYEPAAIVICEEEA